MNDGGVIGFAKNSTASHKGIGASIGHAANVVDLHAAIDFQTDVFAGSLNPFARQFNFAQCALNETLTAKARVNRHDQNKVNVFDDPLQYLQGLGGVEHHAGLATLGLDGLHTAVHMGGGIGVETNQVGSCIGKGGGQGVYGLNHEVHINGHVFAIGCFGMRLERLTNHGAKSEVGHVMVVHHVVVNPVGASGYDVAHFFAQAGKVGGQQRGGNAVGGHVFIVAFCAPVVEALLEVMLGFMGEFDLIETYFKRPPRHAVLGVGDDCALLAVKSGQQLAISSDMLVEGRHFLPTVNPAYLGHKALAVNLSDLAACGAQPKAFLLSLALPEVVPQWLSEFSKGMWALADAHHCDLIGGDTTRGPLNICITVLGEVPQAMALLRGGAKVGDDIYVSGHLGDARLALEVFRGTLTVPQAVFEAARLRMDKPTPRVELGLALRGLAHSAVDVSDGLLGDLQHILKASGVGAEIDTQQVLSTMACGQSSGLKPDDLLRLTLAGGDDYELVFTAPENQRQAIASASASSATPVTRIGKITAHPHLSLLDNNGQSLPHSFESFDHFKTP